MSCVYLWMNRVNGKVYVGQTWNFRSRMNTHRLRAKTEKHPFYAAIRKYGWSRFDLISIPVSSQEEMDNLECLWIIALQTTDRAFGYNLTSGGGNGRHAPESIQKMRRVKLGRVASLESRQKASLALRGIVRSPETRAKMSAGKKGIKFSAQHLENMRLCQLGKKQSAETRKLRSESMKRTLAIKRQNNGTVLI